VKGVGVRVDGDGAVTEVDVVALQAGELAPATPCPRCGDHEEGGGGAAEVDGVVRAALRTP
jgi:hypothetical protein